MAKKVKNASNPTKKVSSSKITITQPASSSVTEPINNPEKNRAARAIAFIFIFCILLFLLAYMFKGVIVAASVNGENISRIAVIKTLEKQSGRLVLDSLITKKLILQEADKRMIVITQQDIDNEIKTISENLKKQGTTLEKAMEGQGITKEELNDEIKVSIALKKMTESNSKISEKEINDFIKTNSEQFPQGTTEDQMKSMAKMQLEQQKSGERTQNLISELQKKAKIIHYAGY